MLSTLKNAVPATLAITALAAGLAAQTPPRILALTENAPVLAQIDATCNVTSCTPPLGPAITPWAGGTAHDPRDRNTWISDGLVLRKVDPRGGCVPSCPVITPAFATAATPITGLAFNEELQRLFISYSNNRIAWFNAAGCTLAYLGDCFVPVPVNHVLTALATEDATQEIYYSSSPFLGGLPNPDSLVYRASQFAPCAPLCPPFRVPDCTPGVFTRLITGLAFDSCTRELHITDGWSVTSVTNTWFCQPTITACCPAPVITSGDRMTGLCVLPSTEVSVGGNCFSGTSPVCPTMKHVLRGDPTLGNLGFALDLVDAPAGSIAYVFFGLGGCVPPGTTFSGLICAPVLPPTFYSAMFTVGAGCNATASIPFPIPNIPFFCGITISSQYIGQMPPSWAGSYVSNCLTWSISAS